MTRAWPDKRIVLDSACLGLDGSYGGATRFACQMKVSYRPARIPAAQWNAVVVAIRSGDGNRVADAMGIPAGGSKATVNAIVHRWGFDHPTSMLTGLRVTARGSALFPSPLTSAGFASSRKAQTLVRASIPAVEAYYSDNGTYAGMTVAALRKIDYAIPRRRFIAAAD